MANTAYLIASDSIGFDFDNGSCLREAVYCVPAFWLTLFDESCLRSFRDDDGDLPYLTSDLTSASARARTAIPQFRNTFVDSDRYCSQWLAWIANLSCSFVQADVSEVLFMDDELETSLSPAMQYLEKRGDQNASAYLSLIHI